MSHLSTIYTVDLIVENFLERWWERLCSNGHTILHFFTQYHTFLHPFSFPTTLVDLYTHRGGQ